MARRENERRFHPNDLDESFLDERELWCESVHEACEEALEEEREIARYAIEELAASVSTDD